METWRLLHCVAEQDGPMVLATIVGVEGHAYRKTGAAMLFAEGGRRFGSISPGCLEQDLELRLDELYERGRAEVVEYDMRSPEDAAWGEAIGCGGRIAVLLEPVKGWLRELLCAAYRLNLEGRTVRLHRNRVHGALRYRLSLDKPSPRRMTGKADWSVSTFEPLRRLVLFGAGEDARPIASAARGIGLSVTVADWREALCTAERFPGAEFVVGSVPDVAARLGMNARDYIVVCSHHFQRDCRFLEAAASAAPAYLGVVGSASRIERLTEGLAMPDTFSGPVGLPIGAEGPEEIAVSIAAELILVRRGMKADKKGVWANEGGRHLFGGRTKQAHGRAEAVAGAYAGTDAGGGGLGGISGL